MPSIPPTLSGLRRSTCAILVDFNNHLFDVSSWQNCISVIEQFGGSDFDLDYKVYHHQRCTKSLVRFWQKKFQLISKDYYRQTYTVALMQFCLSTHISELHFCISGRTFLHISSGNLFCMYALVQFEHYSCNCLRCRSILRFAIS